MTDPLLNSLFLFTISAAAGYGITKVLERLRPVVPVGAKVRLRMAGGVARSVLVAQHREEWTFSALLQRFAGDLPEPGDSILVEATGPKGAYLFRVRVRSVDPEPFALRVDPPARVFKLDRRSDRRSLELPDHASIDGLDCQVKDLSPGGASLLTVSGNQAGDRVTVKLGELTMPAWVLDSRPVEGGKRSLRVCFDQELPS